MKQFIDKYPIQIGISLIAVILVGSIFLMVKNSNASNTASSSSSSEIAAKDQEIADLKKQIEELKTSADQSPKSETVAPTTAQSNLININTATLSELDSLPGIGPAYAQRIIDYRTSKGGFSSINDLLNVKGIGNKTLEKFKDKITL